MENILQAIERAKGQPKQRSGISFGQSQGHATHFGDAVERDNRVQEVELDFAHLQSQRIVAYDGKDLRARPFDVLRTEVSRTMDLKGWKTLAVTSPTPGCGKTLTAVNLALSLARQPERQVFLADLDLRKPQVAGYLGVKCRDGLLGVVEERLDLGSAIIHGLIFLRKAGPRVERVHLVVGGVSLPIDISVEGRRMYAVGPFSRQTRRHPECGPGNRSCGAKEVIV